MNLLIPFLAFIIAGSSLNSADNPVKTLREKLCVKSSGYTAIEIGGPYLGIEFCDNLPLPARIGLFYPLANTIDMADNNGGHMKMDMKIDGRDVELFSKKRLKYELTPYGVVFKDEGKEKDLLLKYQFCRKSPAALMTFEITNKTDAEKTFEISTQIDLSLRTSHTYTPKNLALMSSNAEKTDIFADFTETDAGKTRVFILNAGEKPAAIGPFDNDKKKPVTPIASFTYRKKLSPGEKMVISQLIGSCPITESDSVIKEVMGNYQADVVDYENYILSKVFDGRGFTTGDKVLDHSVLWAKAIMAANYHNLENALIPMPCPVKYNFFFIHDVFLTDLGAVFFDIDRVSKDLDYVYEHRLKDNLLPHAYYWKDKEYKTEPVESDNWNNLWFLMVSARYYRHSGDREKLAKLYPLMEKSIERVMEHYKNGMIYAHRPDWWDLGNSYGPRTYMTLLTSRALSEFLYISRVLNKKPEDYAKYEKLALELKESLSNRLWDKEMKFPVNFFKDGSRDNHLYIGSLTAAHFGLLEGRKKEALIKTAKEKLLDPKVGIYNAYPMDFHNLKEYLKLNGNEAGDEYIYMNGGIWSQGNAWYALALISDEKRLEALNFIRDIMTVKGVMKSPCGQPAMYECRSGDPRTPESYGLIQKPQFLWAAGWYLYDLYHLFGIRENLWNTSFSPFLDEGREKVSFSLFVKGIPIEVVVTGRGSYIESISYDGRVYPSAVIPETPPGRKVLIRMGSPSVPTLLKTDSILKEAEWNRKKKTLTLNLAAFEGHGDEILIQSPIKPVTLRNREKSKMEMQIDRKGDIFLIKIPYVHKSENDKLIISFQG